MSESDSSKGPGIWSKLLIWVVVIVAGFFYLRAINEKGMENRHQGGAAQTAETPPAGSGGEAEVQATSAVPVESVSSPESGSQSGPIASDARQPAPSALEPEPGQSDVLPASRVEPAGSAPVHQQGPADIAASPMVDVEPVAQQAAEDESAKQAQFLTPAGVPVPEAVESGAAGTQAGVEFFQVPLSAEPSPVAPSVPAVQPERAQRPAVSMPSTSPVPAEPTPPPAVSMPSTSPVPAEPTPPPAASMPSTSPVPAEPTPPPAESTAPSTLAQPEPPRISAPSVPAEPAVPVSTDPAASSAAVEGTEGPRTRAMAEREARQRRYWEQRQWPHRGTRGWPRMRPTGPYGTYYPGYGSQYYGPWQ